MIFGKKPRVSYLEDKSHSVVESLDYPFAMHVYPKEDFRSQFTQHFIASLREELGIEVFNCKIETPDSATGFVNVYLYYKDTIPDLAYRIDDLKSPVIAVFYQTLKEHPLPNLPKKVQFLQRSIVLIQRAYTMSQTMRAIGDDLIKEFSGVERSTYWNMIYIFLEPSYFASHQEMPDFVRRLKDYCYREIKKRDTHHVFTYETFTIRIDDVDNYTSIGGRNYFNSDAMFNAPEY